MLKLTRPAPDPSIPRNARRYQVKREKPRRPPVYRRGVTDNTALPSFVVLPKLLLIATADAAKELLLGRQEVPGMAFLGRLHYVLALTFTVFAFVRHSSHALLFSMEFMAFPTLFRMFQISFKKFIFRLAKEDATEWTEIP